MHVNLIGQYSKYKRQEHLGGAIIMNNFSLTCTTTIDPATDWFGIIKVPTFALNEVISTHASPLGLLSGILHRLRSLG